MKYVFEFKNFRKDQEVKPLLIKNSFSLENIITIYYNRFSPKFKFHGESHNFYEFYYVANGNMIATINNKKYYLGEGDYIMTPPMLWHSMEPNNTYAVGVAVCFDATNYKQDIFGGKLTSFDKQLLGNILNIYAKNYNEAEFRPKILPTRIEKDYAYGQALKAQIEILLIDILQNQQRKKTEISQSNKGEKIQAQQILKYIEENFRENPSLASIAKDLNYSVPHICRIFKKTYNESIVDYMIRVKIDEAMKLIEQNEKSLKEISEFLGFDNVAYFSRIFKKHTNMTPSEYRKIASFTHLLNPKYVPTNNLIN